MLRTGTVDREELLDRQLRRGAARRAIGGVANQYPSGRGLTDQLPEIAIRAAVDIVDLTGRLAGPLSMELLMMDKLSVIGPRPVFTVSPFPLRVAAVWLTSAGPEGDSKRLHKVLGREM